MDDPPLPSESAAAPLPWTQRLSRWFARYREISPEEQEEEARKAEEVTALIEKVAEWVVRRRLETPATLYLEAHKPFSHLGSQMLLVGTPFMAPIFGMNQVDQWYHLMEKSENVDRLIQRIEELMAEMTNNSKQANMKHPNPVEDGEDMESK